MFHILVKFYCLKCMSFLQISFPLKLLFKVVYFKGRERERIIMTVFFHLLLHSPRAKARPGGRNSTLISHIGGGLKCLGHHLLCSWVCYRGAGLEACQLGTLIGAWYGTVL